MVPDPPRFELISEEPGIIIVKFAPTHTVLPVLGYRIQWRLITDKVWREARYHNSRDGKKFKCPSNVPICCDIKYALLKVTVV